MLQVLSGIFFILHGLVHILYYGQASKWFELGEGMSWPDGSWAFSRMMGDERARKIARADCLLAAILFVLGGIGVLSGQPWWRMMTALGAIFSGLIFIFFWDGKKGALPAKGIFAVLINMVILLLIFVFRWPDFGF